LGPSQRRSRLSFCIAGGVVHHRPRDVGQHSAVEFGSFQRTIAVLIEPKEHLWRHPANQQQLLHRLQGFVEGSIGIGQLAVVVAFGTKLPWLFIFIDPIEDGIGDLFGHPRESHQQLSSDVGQRTKGIGCGAEFGGDSHRREVGTPGHLLHAAKLLVDDH
jgi:hypothetical protein